MITKCLHKYSHGQKIWLNVDVMSTAVESPLHVIFIMIIMIMFFFVMCKVDDDGISPLFCAFVDDAVVRLQVSVSNTSLTREIL